MSIESDVMIFLMTHNDHLYSLDALKETFPQHKRHCILHVLKELVKDKQVYRIKIAGLKVYTTINSGMMLKREYDKSLVSNSSHPLYEVFELP